MTSLERLRLAVALGHAVPGAELRLRTVDDEQIVVASEPHGAISPCVMRRVAIASSWPNVPDHSAKIVDIEVGGSLEDLGGGVYRVERDGIEQRWIASTLHPDAISDLLDLVGLDTVPADAMHGCLKPDCELGVTLLVVTSTDLRYSHALDDIAAQAATSMIVEELLQRPADSVRSSQRSGGAA
ncbi:hypothetical protein [Ilumatobacter coccineus]|uniref:Uncharacterized protein n=1 Tax=Ilumatobacter coccineus (strain NBRC 103263 / KCTC 29153 / YM16-304) TaxID=1313172 RepID=A0A6C7EDQ4_ILUCY|nr:hypothetical protein [Ilumatobacter coccineus]BAN04443.1 hypothetical protein YM304_41290 [Ilumatobacter coccineus YM16-304]